MKKILVIFLALGIAVILLPSAWAASTGLTAGGGSVTPGSNGEFTTVTSTMTLEDTLAISLSSSVSATEDVYKTSGGTLDFFFQVDNTNTSDPLSTIAAVDNLGWGVVSVAYDIPATLGLAPTGANQTANGQTVNFTYGSSGAGTLTGNSDWLEIDTNATTFALQSNGFDVIDGVFTPAAAYVPTPEPVTTGIVGGALALMALVVRRRSAKKA